MLDTILLQIAKTAILSSFDNSVTLNNVQLLRQYPFLEKNGVVFVTLNSNHQLRGCIGSIIAHRTLLEDIIHNALSAAFQDPRFNQLSASELDVLTLEVSVLSEPELLVYTDYSDLLKKVTPHVDGLILKHGPYQGTFFASGLGTAPDT